MNVAEIETLKAAIAVLDKHGYHAAAEPLREALVAEFAAAAETLHDINNK